MSIEITAILCIYHEPERISNKSKRVIILYRNLNTMTMHYYWVSVFEHKFEHSEGQPLQCDRWPAKKLSSHTVYSPAHFERFRRTINLGRRRFWLVSYVGPVCFTKKEEGPRIVTNEIAGRDTSKCSQTLPTDHRCRAQEHLRYLRRTHDPHFRSSLLETGDMNKFNLLKCEIIKVLVVQLDLYWRNL